MNWWHSKAIKNRQNPENIKQFFIRTNFRAGHYPFMPFSSLTKRTSADSNSNVSQTISQHSCHSFVGLTLRWNEIKIIFPFYCIILNLNFKWVSAMMQWRHTLLTFNYAHECFMLMNLMLSHSLFQHIFGRSRKKKIEKQREAARSSEKKSLNLKNFIFHSRLPRTAALRWMSFSARQTKRNATN